MFQLSIPTIGSTKEKHVFFLTKNTQQMTKSPPKCKVRPRSKSLSWLMKLGYLIGLFLGHITLYIYIYITIGIMGFTFWSFTVDLPIFIVCFSIATVDGPAKSKKPPKGWLKACKYWDQPSTNWCRILLRHPLDPQYLRLSFCFLKQQTFHFKSRQKPCTTLQETSVQRFFSASTAKAPAGPKDVGGHGAMV